MKLYLIALCVLSVAAAPPGEVIAFKGLGFNQKGATVAVVNFCRSKLLNGFADNNSESDCVVEHNALTVFTSYGVLPIIQTILRVDEDDTLAEVSLITTRGGVQLEIAPLTSRYGKPTVFVEAVSNKLGVKFTKTIYSWRDKFGTRIVAQDIYETTDQGIITIESKTSYDKKRVESNKRDTDSKNNL